MTYTEKQRIASEILTEFMLSQDYDETWDNIFEKYELMIDPFTSTPCSCEDYWERG